MTLFISPYSSRPVFWPKCGEFVIDSMPPAITTSYSPARIAEAAIITAFRLEPHTLLMVVHGVECGSPAPIAT